MSAPSIPTSLPAWHLRQESDGSLSVLPAPQPNPFLRSIEMPLQEMLLSGLLWAHWDGRLWRRLSAPAPGDGGASAHFGPVPIPEWIALNERLGGSLPEDCILLDGSPEAYFGSLRSAAERLALDAGFSGEAPSPAAKPFRRI